jgi:hypothetical protein
MSGCVHFIRDPASFAPFDGDAEVLAGRPVADVPGGGIVPFGRTVDRQLAGKRSGLLDAAKAWAVSRPMPEPAPVTTATWPRKS